MWMSCRENKLGQKLEKQAKLSSLPDALCYTQMLTNLTVGINHDPIDCSFLTSRLVGCRSLTMSCSMDTRQTCCHMQ